MAIAFYRWLKIGLYVAKVLNEVAEWVKESTPEERAQIVKHVVAIYDVLKAATQRESLNANLPMLMLAPSAPEESVADRSDRMRNALIAFRRTFQRYRHHLNNANRKEIMEHARELARIVAEIEKRTRARRRGQI